MTSIANGRSPHILVIDDDLEIGQLLLSQLVINNYSVTLADSGDKGLEILQSPLGSKGPFDAVILDLLMPDVDGYEVLKRIRSNPKLKDLQVIVLTCMTTGEHKERALEVGANDFISKPWDMVELISRIEIVLGRKETEESFDLLNKNLDALRISSQALLGVHSLEEILIIILRELKNVVNYSSSSIMLIEQDHLKIVASAGFRSNSQEFSYKELESLDHIQDVIRSRRPVIINNTFEDKRWVHLSDSDYIASWIGVPLINKGEIIGVLNVDIDVLEYYSDHDADLAVGFALQASLAIENARLLTRLKRQSNLAKALVTASGKLAETRDVELQLQAVWEFVFEQMHAPIFYVGFCDELRNVLDIIMLFDMGVKQPQKSISLSGNIPPTLSSYVALNGNSIGWNNEEERAEIISKLNIHPNVIGATSCSCLVQPLISEGKIIGVISIQDNKPYSWDEIDIDTFIALAGMVAATVNNSQLFHNIQNDQDRLFSAYDASHDIESISDPDEILPNIVEQLYQVMKCTQVSVILIDERGKPIHVAIKGYSKFPELPASMRMNGISSQVVKSGVPIFMDDLTKYEHEVHPDLIARGVKASACIPLTQGVRNIGVLWVHFNELHHFTQAEQNTLGLFARQAATTYESVRRLDELERLRGTVNLLASASAPAEVLDLIVEKAKEEFRADSTALWVYDDEQGIFVIESSVASGITPDKWSDFILAEPLRNRGGTAYTVIQKGWLGITNIDDPEERAIIGQSTYELLASINVKSFQGVTLRDGDEILGVLYINYSQEHGFSSTEREFAQAFVSQASLAYNKSKLFEQLGKAKQTAHIVAEHTALGDFNKTLNSIVRGTRSVIGCNSVTLYVYDQDRNQFSFPPAMDGVIYPEKVTELDFIEKNSVPYRMIALDDVYLSERADEDPMVRGGFTEREKIMSFAGIPLISHNIKVGVMCMNFRRRHRFTTSDITNINMFAMQAAVAIQNGGLYKLAKEKAEILEELHKASQFVIRSLKLHDILQDIVIQASLVAGIHGKKPSSSCIGLLDKSNRIIFEAAYPKDYFNKLMDNLPYIDLKGIGPHGVCGRAVQKGKSQLVGDVEKDEDFIPFDNKSGSEVAVPIVQGGNIIGVINVEHPEKKSFNEEDLVALEILASYASIAIQNAKVFHELQETKLNVQSMANLAWTGTVANAWRHSIGNYSVIVSDLAKLIRIDLEDNADLNTVYNNLTQIETTIREIQSIPMIPLSADNGVESVLINQLIMDRVKQYSRKGGRFSKVHYTFLQQCESSISVRASWEWVRRVLDILLDNAVNAMADSPKKILTIRTDIEIEYVKISVIDTGPGIPSNILSKLFEFPIEKSKGEKGSGVGLFLAKEIARTYGGWIEIGPNNSDGTTMIAFFPVEK